MAHLPLLRFEMKNNWQHSEEKDRYAEQDGQAIRKENEIAYNPTKNIRW
jgi:hypothetical protein